MKRKTGYDVWLYGKSFWHRTLQGAGRRLKESNFWCGDGQHAQAIEVSSGKNVTNEAWEASG